VCNMSSEDDFSDDPIEVSDDDDDFEEEVNVL
jgi:hypothetical protein